MHLRALRLPLPGAGAVRRAPRWILAVGLGASLPATPLRADEPPPQAAPVKPAGTELVKPVGTEQETPAPTSTAPSPSAALQRPALDGGLSLVSLARHVKPSVLELEVRSTGRGVITRQAVVVDASGWLVMAGPTLAPTDVVRVRLSPTQVVTAVPVGSDARTALTLLQVPTPLEPLRPLALPTAPPRTPLRLAATVGQTVVLVTARGAVARGPVRALERVHTIVDAGRGVTVHTTGLLEAALASVPGDVGSPWVDSQGQCVGLTMGGVVEDPLADDPPPPDLEIRVEPTAAHAVPAEVVALVWPLLRDHQTVPRSRLGVKARQATEALRAHFCGGCGGQEIAIVDPGGPAAQAGVEPEDLLLALDGVPLRAGASLGDSLLPYRPLDTVTLTLLRRGDKVQKVVVLGARETQPR
jgi:putative serine protease PepD